MISYRDNIATTKLKRISKRLLSIGKNFKMDANGGHCGFVMRLSIRFLTLASLDTTHYLSADGRYLIERITETSGRRRVLPLQDFSLA